MSESIQDQLPELLRLARERSEEARIELAGKLAKIFTDNGEEFSPHEWDLFNDLMGQLLRAKSISVCQKLVQSFGNAALMPRRMAMMMAVEDVSTARPVLENNYKLTDDDLVTIVQTQSTDHAVIIANRNAVNEAVADALVATGDVIVMQTVAENLGARLSNKAMETLIDAARITLCLQNATLKRPELTAPMAARLYWWTGHELRRQVLQRFGIKAGQIETALALSIEEKLNSHVFEKYDDNAMNKVADWLEERSAATPRIFIQLLRQGHYRLFSILLSRLTHLEINAIDEIVGMPGGRALAAICRALSVEKTSFVSIFLLSRGARGDDQHVNPQELTQVLSSFDRISTRVAQAMLNSWRQDSIGMQKSLEKLMMSA